MLKILSWALIGIFGIIAWFGIITICVGSNRKSTKICEQIQFKNK